VKTTVLIVLEVEAHDPSEVFAAIDRYLDFGDLQDALHDPAEGIRVLSATSITHHQYLEAWRDKL